MKCDFVVGQRVVCIEDDWPDWAICGLFIVPGHVRVPMINEVLTIKEIVPVVSRHLVEDGVGLIFHEIEGGWSYRAFRPLEEKPTDISIFTDMLNRVGEPVDA